jgi:magnesium transporter
MPSVILIRTEDLAEDAKALHMERMLLSPLDKNAANRFEDHREYACILLNIPDKSGVAQAPPVNIDIYCMPRRLILVHDPSPAVDALTARLDASDAAETTPFSHVLYAFFALLTEKDADDLEEVEANISALEDAVAAGGGKDFIAEISRLRKRLLRQKRYFESLLDALEMMEKEAGRFFSSGQLRHLQLIARRADRQFHSVLNLRDYLTQVREAYQAQMDIGLNKTMQLFTAISAIFLPLTLIVGWYGMNLPMPEISSPYIYPAVIAVCLCIVIGLALYFGKKKWF